MFPLYVFRCVVSCCALLSCAARVNWKKTVSGKGIIRTLILVDFDAKRGGLKRRQSSSRAIRLAKYDVSVFHGKASKKST